MEAVQTIQADRGVQRGLMIFAYEGIRLRESCWIDGKPYFTMRAIGEWLEAKHPNRYVKKIIERNPHILTFRTFVNLTNVEGDRNVTREVEVFDPIGLQLIIFESHQPKAKQYKIAVAHLVYDYATGNLKPFKWSGDIASAISQIISMPAGSKRKLKVFELAKETGKAWGTIYRMAKKMNGENLKVKGDKPKKTRADAGSFVHYPEFQQAKDYLIGHPGAGGKEIQAALGIHYSTSSINRWIRYIRGEQWVKNHSDNSTENINIYYLR